jgi:Telomeric single stranded DNA binding POT1/CDC13
MAMTSLVAIPRSPRLSHASRCSITELAPTIDDQAFKFIDGIVSLIWPYSSSTHRTAILLADPDFRIRRQKGQTKVTFHGNAGVAVAESHVGIGDTVHLSLGGAQWTEPGNNVHTLGKRADWDLEYAEQVYMEVQRGTASPAVVDLARVQEPVGGALREIDGNGAANQRTPRTRRSHELWSSSAFTKQISQSSPPLHDSSWIPSVPNDGSFPGHGRKRAKFSRDSGSWRYLERSPTSEGEEEKHALDIVAPLLKQQVVLETTPDAARSSPERQEVNSAEVETHDLSLNDVVAKRHLDMPPELLMPPPPQNMQQEQPSGVSSDAPSAVASHVVPLPETEDLRAVLTATPPRASTPRLLPLTSLGVPLISPLIKRHGAFTGYFPIDFNTQSELDSSAEGLFKENEYNAENAPPPSTSPLSVHSSTNRMTEEHAVVASTPTASQMVDLISPTEADECSNREETNQKMQAGLSPNDHHSLSLAAYVVSPIEAEFANDASISSQPNNRTNSENFFHQPSESMADATLAKSSIFVSVTSTNTTPSVPLSPGEGMKESKDAAPDFAEEIEHLSALEQHPTLSKNEADSISDLHATSNTVDMEAKEIEQEAVAQSEIGPIESAQPAIEPIEMEQGDTRSPPLSAPRRPVCWTEVLEVSAREVEDYDLSIKAPPFPFKQRWDNKAKKESKARQATQATGFYMSRRKSYDGVEDASISMGGSSGVVSDVDSESKSPFCDQNNDLVQGDIEGDEGRSQIGGDDSEVTDEDESTSRSEVNGGPTDQVIEVDSKDSDTTPTNHAEIKHGMMVPQKRMEGETEVSLESVKTDIHLIDLDDGSGQQSPASTEKQDYMQRSLDMTQSSSPSPSLTAGKGNILSTASSTPSSPHLLLDPHTEEHTGTHVTTEKLDFVNGFSPISQDPSAPQVCQLATPNNTQIEVQYAQSQGLQELRDPDAQVELPPSPQNTQDLRDSQNTNLAQPLDVKEAEQYWIEGAAATEPDSRAAMTEPNDKLAALSLKETQRRRSSRLSGRMPLLGKDPSEISSPYFTPKRANQDGVVDKVPSSPPHRSLSPSGEARDKIVVLIPPTDKGSSLDVPLSITPSTPIFESPPTKRRFNGKGFTTPRSYYPSLSSVPTHFSEQIDVLAVAIMSKQPQQAKSGPKDYFVSLTVADSSCGAGDSVSIELFRPHRTALPACSRGDVLLLRGLKVQTRRTLGTRGKGRGNQEIDGMMLISTESSSWAIFKFPPTGAVSAVDGRPGSSDSLAHSAAKRGTPIKLDVQINGPPVEYGAEERAFVRGLNKWWLEEGEAIFPEVKSGQSQQVKGKGKEKPDELEVQEGQLREHESRDGMAYDDVMSPKAHEHLHGSDEVLMGGDEASLYEHELRDGKAYGDTISHIPIHEHFHEHHHDHPLNHSHPDDADGSRLGGADALDEEHSLHEHELRDGMAYGDTISQTPIHQHFPHASDRSDSLNDDGSSIALDRHLRSSGCLHPTPPQEADRSIHSHNLRHGISYAASSASASANLKNAALSTSTIPRAISKRRSLMHESEAPNGAGVEAEAEVVHILRDGTRYTISESPARGSVGGASTSAIVSESAGRRKSIRRKK